MSEDDASCEEADDLLHDILALDAIHDESWYQRKLASAQGFREAHGFSDEAIERLLDFKLRPEDRRDG